MSIITYPLDGIRYGASDVETYLSTRTSGVFSADDNFDINIVSDGRTVVISSGIAWINDGKFKGKSIVSTENVRITIEKSSVALSLMHRIVLRFNETENKSEIILVSGEHGTGKAPEPIRNGGIYDLVLYTIKDDYRKYMLQRADIIDERLNEKVCGIVRDGVERIPTDVLMARANALLAELEGRLDNIDGEGGGSGGGASAVPIYRDTDIDELEAGLYYAVGDINLIFVTDREPDPDITGSHPVSAGSFIIKTIGQTIESGTDEIVNGAGYIYIVPSNQDSYDEFGNKTTLLMQKIIPVADQYDIHYELADDIKFDIEVAKEIPDDPASANDYANIHPNYVPSVKAMIDYVSKNAGAGGGGSADAVLYTEQTLTDEQKAQARSNIGVDEYIEQTILGGAW